MPKHRISTLGSVLTYTREWVEDRKARGVFLVSTGSGLLDSLMGGGYIPREENVGIKAKAKIGKTTMLVDSYLSSWRAGQKPLFVGLEEHIRQLGIRINSRSDISGIGIDRTRVRMNHLDNADFEAMKVNEQAFEGQDIFVLDTSSGSNIDMGELVTDALELGSSTIFLDYFGLAAQYSRHQGKNEWDTLDLVARQIIDGPKQGINFVVLIQENRAGNVYGTSKLDMGLDYLIELDEDVNPESGKANKGFVRAAVVLARYSASSSDAAILRVDGAHSMLVDSEMLKNVDFSKVNTGFKSSKKGKEK